MSTTPSPHETWLTQEAYDRLAAELTKNKAARDKELGALGAEKATLVRDRDESLKHFTQVEQAQKRHDSIRLAEAGSTQSAA